LQHRVFSERGCVAVGRRFAHELATKVAIQARFQRRLRGADCSSACLQGFWQLAGFEFARHAAHGSWCPEFELGREESAAEGRRALLFKAAAVSLRQAMQRRSTRWAVWPVVRSLCLSRAVSTRSAYSTGCSDGVGGRFGGGAVGWLGVRHCLSSTPAQPATVVPKGGSTTAFPMCAVRRWTPGRYRSKTLESLEYQS
jgi:hypothetical protein